MAYTIKTLANGHRFAQLPDGSLIPNQGRYPARVLTDAEIAVNFADFNQTPRYNEPAVEAEIRKDRRIGGREAKMIHALLKGRS